MLLMLAELKVIAYVNQENPTISNQIFRHPITC